MRWNRKFLPVQQFNRRNGTQELGRSLVDRGELVLRYGLSQSQSRYRRIRFPESSASAPQHSAPQTGRTAIPKQMAAFVHRFFGLE
jgi:hypothetical protein